MALFRKLGQNLIPAFRKLPSEVNVLGRKISNTASQIERGVGKAQDIVGKIDKAIPNPITKIIGEGLGAVKDVSGAVSTGGQALRAGSRGDIKSAIGLGKQAFQQGTKGFQEGASTAGKVATFL